MLKITLDVTSKRKKKGVIRMSGELNDLIRETGWVVHALWQQVPPELAMTARAALLEEIKLQMRRD